MTLRSRSNSRRWFDTSTSLAAIGVAALVLAGLSAWLFLPGTPASPVPPPRPVIETPPKPVPVPVEEPTGEDLDPESEIVPVAPEEALPTDGYPWAAPKWWDAMETRLREAKLRLPREPILVSQLLIVLADELKVPVVAGDEIVAWAEKRTWFMSGFDGSAASLMEEFTTVHNLEVIPLEDRVTLRARRRAVATRVEEASRVQWLLARARWRADNGASAGTEVDEELLEHSVDLALDAVPLRDAIVRLEAILEVPVMMDRVLWNLNPAISTPAGARPLSEWLAGTLKPKGIAWEARARQLLLWKASAGK
jgi:hypothetical protein